MSALAPVQRGRSCRGSTKSATPTRALVPSSGESHERIWHYHMQWKTLNLNMMHNEANILTNHATRPAIQLNRAVLLHEA